MKIICNACGYLIDRDKIIKGQIVEEYENIYGTRCPNCGVLNKSSFETSEMIERKMKMELLKEQVRDSLRKKIRR